jgi:hypothetical protein
MCILIEVGVIKAGPACGHVRLAATSTLSALL